MKLLKKAVYDLMAGSAFGTAIGNRLYEGRAPQNPTTPYAIYHVVGPVPDRTFTEDLVDAIVQFSLFSEASDETEILDANASLVALYDRCSLSAVGWKQIFLELASGEGEVTDYPADTLSGTGAYFQSDVEFKLLGSRA